MPDTAAAPPPDTAHTRPQRNLIARLVPVLAFVAGAGAGGAGATFAAMQFATPHVAAAPAATPVLPAEYVDIDNVFTSNLVDSGRFLQVKLNVSTTAGPDAVTAIERHKPALISAVLAVLGDCSEADIADRAAKDKLRDRLRDTINQTLKNRGEPFRVEDVFLTSLFTQ